jgi:hypothetical protein
MNLLRLSLAWFTASALNIASASPIWPQPTTTSANPQINSERQALFLRGAQLWPIYCNTCHNARTGAELSPSEWRMVMMHMRTQANLPPQDARAILEYLRSSR